MSDNLFEVIGKVSQTKGFKRKKGKKAKSLYIAPINKTLIQKVKKELDKPSKIGGEGLLPVKPINDGGIWSDKQVQQEIHRAMLPDVTTKVLESDIAPKFLQTEQVTAEHVKRWIPRGIRAIRGKNPGYRMSGRFDENTGEDKKWAKPHNFFLLADNSISTDKFMREDPQLQKEGFDVAMQVYENILQYGRRTMPELMEDLGALQPELVSMVANGMINDHYLKIVTEIEMEPITNKPIIKDGNRIVLETMELVEEKERLDRIKRYSRALEEKKQVKALGNGKRSSEKITKDKRRNTRRLDNGQLRSTSNSKRKANGNKKQDGSTKRKLDEVRSRKPNKRVKVIVKPKL